MESLLVSLRRYRPRENTDPLENFITEAFAWLLRNHEGLSRSFIEYLAKELELSDQSFDPAFDSINWSTQENFNGFYPDMVARLGSTTLIFEHKVHSSLHHDQLRNYRTFADTQGWNHRMVLITADVHQHAQSPCFACCWRDIYQLFADYLKDSKDDREQWAIEEFLLLLKNEGLGPKAPASYSAIRLYQDFLNLPDALAAIISFAEDKSWDALKKFGYSFSRNTNYGRQGLLFSRETGWTPSIFAGFVLNPKDHCIAHRSRNGLNLVIIISFSQDLHNKYPKSELAQKFVLELKTLTDQSHWNFYNHAEDPEIRSNPWHPYYLEQPLAELLANTESLTEQRELCFEQMKDAVELIISAPSFKAMLEEMER